MTLVSAPDVCMQILAPPPEAALAALCFLFKARAVASRCALVAILDVPIGVVRTMRARYGDDHA